MPILMWFSRSACPVHGKGRGSHKNTIKNWLMMKGDWRGCELHSLDMKVDKSWNTFGWWERTTGNTSAFAGYFASCKTRFAATFIWLDFFKHLVAKYIFLLFVFLWQKKTNNRVFNERSTMWMLDGQLAFGLMRSYSRRQNQLFVSDKKRLLK